MDETWMSMKYRKGQRVGRLLWLGFTRFPRSLEMATTRRGSEPAQPHPPFPGTPVATSDSFSPPSYLLHALARRS